VLSVLLFLGSTFYSKYTAPSRLAAPSPEAQ